MGKCCHSLAILLSHISAGDLLEYPAGVSAPPRAVPLESLNHRPDFNIDGLGFEFLKTDLAVGQKFVEIARAAVHDPAKRERNRVRAQESYDMVLAFVPRIRLRDEERNEIDAALQQLRCALAELDGPG